MYICGSGSLDENYFLGCLTSIWTDDFVSVGKWLYLLEIGLCKMKCISSSLTSDVINISHAILWMMIHGLQGRLLWQVILTDDFANMQKWGSGQHRLDIREWSDFSHWYSSVITVIDKSARLMHYYCMSWKLISKNSWHPW